MGYGSRSYAGVNYSGVGGPREPFFATLIDVDVDLPAELMFSSPSELETWDAEESQRLNVDIVLVVGLQVFPPPVPPPAVFSDTGPTGPTGTGPTGALP